MVPTSGKFLRGFKTPSKKGPNPPHPSRGFQYKGFGADMVMEIYWVKLSTAAEDERALAEGVMRAARLAPFAQIQSLVRGLEDELS